MTTAEDTRRGNERVAAVLARAAALSDELRGTIRELEKILRQGEDVNPK